MQYGHSLARCHHREPDGRVRLRGRACRLRCRSASLHGHPRRETKGVYSPTSSDPLQPDEGLSAHQQDPIRTGKKVAVVGGGNVAMDAARSALRLGAETVYTSTAAAWLSCPPRKEEVEHAARASSSTLCNPCGSTLGRRGLAASITCVEMELGEPDALQCRRPIAEGQQLHGCGHGHYESGHQPQPADPLHLTPVWRPTSTAASLPTATTANQPGRWWCTPAAKAVTGAATVIRRAMGAGKAAARH